MSLNGSLIEKRTLYGHLSSGSRGGGTSDHEQLTNRDAANQHPMSAITGLENALDSKQDAISDEDIVEQFARAHIITPVASNSGALFINSSGKIFII